MEKKAYFFCISISIIILAAISNQIFLNNINSDTLYAFELADNIIHHKLLLGQNVPAAPYFFPDIALIVFLNSFTHNISVLHFVHATLFLSVFCFIVYELMYLSLKNNFYARLGTLIAIAATFFLVVPYFYFLQEFLCAHLSVIVFSLGFLLFYLKNRTAPLSISFCFFIFIAIFLMFISDNLLFPQLLFPLAVMIMVDAFRKKTNKAFAIPLLTIFFVAIVLGAKIEIPLTHFFEITISNNVSLFRIRKIMELDKTIALALHIFSVSIAENLIGFLLLLWCHVVTLVLAAILFVRRKQQSLDIIFTILFFFYLVQISNLILAILVGKITALPHLRYLDSLFIFPPLALTIVMMQSLVIFSYKKLVKIGGFMIFAGGVVFLLAHYKQLTITSLYKKPYTASIECIDGIAIQYGMTNGLAEYWNVRLVRMLSKDHLKISQISKQLKFLNFTDNKTFFYADLNKKSILNYQFIMVDKLPKAQLVAAVGQPDRIEYCYNQEIWLYVDKKSNERLNQYINGTRDFL